MKASLLKFPFPNGAYRHLMWVNAPSQECGQIAYGVNMACIKKEEAQMRPIVDLMVSLCSLTENNVRQIRKTSEDPPRVSVYDVIGVITGQTPGVHHTILKRLTDNFPEVQTICTNSKFPGQGQRPTPVAMRKGSSL